VKSELVLVHSETTAIQTGVTVASMNANVITATAIQADAITSAKIATDAIGADELAADGIAEIADAVWNEDVADHVAAGTFGEALYANAYAGPMGIGVYINDGAANTATVAGEDGTVGKPVSTFAAARTIADALGVKRYYLQATELSLDATYEDWEFIGLGGRDANILNVGSQDVDRSSFYNLTLEGVQGGTARITAYDCVLQDDATGSTTLYIHAIRCGLASSDPGILLSNNNDHIFDSCYSMVAGNGAPMLDAQSGANVGISMRHYSGGIELKGLSGTSTTSVETDGQVIFNASNTASAPVTIRGLATVTDNHATGMTAVTEGARIDRTAIDSIMTANSAISDVHSRIVVVEASIDSDQTSRTAAISDVKSELVIISAAVATVDAAIDSDQVSRTAAISDVKSRLVVVESAIDSDQTSRTAAISDVHSRLVVVESSIDSDQTSRTAALSDIKSEVSVITTDAHSEPTGVPAANESPLDKLAYLFMVMRNRKTVTSTKKTIYGDDDVGEWEHDVSDNGTTYDESEANVI
jgi:hypothetical protein